MSEEAAGRVLGPYVVESLIGSGGMGAVYRGRDERLHRPVAIKIIQPEHCGNEMRRRRFETEARSAARLAHPNVVQIYDVGEHDGTPYIVTELVEGGTLGERLRKRPLTVQETLAIAIPVAEALADAHQRGVVHRDIKPENILLTPTGAPKLTDFGLAKFLEPEQPLMTDAATARISLTGDGTIVGTPAYMSPEQATGRPVDFRSDLFSFGTILVEMLTGQRPFQRATNIQTLTAILQDDADYTRLPTALVPIIRRCLRKESGERYEKTSDLVGELRRCAEPPAAAKSSKPWIAVAASVIVLIVAAGVMFVSRQKPESAPAEQPAKIASLAILPLQNFSPDKSQDYFADAMTEELTAELASVRSLRVTSRTSASAFRGTTKKLTDVARDLGVDGLIEGSVIRTGDRARITIQLIDGRTDRHVWAQTFERTGADILALQRDVAAEIVRHIEATLSPTERQHLSTLPTHNMEAYQAFLQATYKMSTGLSTEQDADDAVRYAERAVALDPEFAEAWVALARACEQKMFGWNGGKEYDEKGFLAIQRALALDPSLATAYATRGVLQYNRWHEYNIAAAIKDYRRALQLNPNLADAHQLLCSESNHLGLHDQAISECTATLQLDPHNFGGKLRLGRAQWQSNRFQDAVASYERFDIPMFENAVALGYLGRIDDARKVIATDRERRRTARDPRSLQYQEGDRASAEAFLSALQNDAVRATEHMRRAEQFQRDNPHFHHAATILAAAAAELHRPAEAVRYLTIAADTGMPNYPLFANNPSLQKLKGTPEYDRFMSSLRSRWETIMADLSK